MRYALIMAMFFCMVGCGSSSNDSLPIATQSQTAKTVSFVQSADSAVELPPAQIITVNGVTSIALNQPSLGWMPTWEIVNGTIYCANDVFHATVTPTNDNCVVTVTWHFLDEPPQPPSAVN